MQQFEVSAIDINGVVLRDIETGVLKVVTIANYNNLLRNKQIVGKTAVHADIDGITPYSGDRLKDLCDVVLDGITQCRDCVSIMKNCVDKIIMISGIRRTGKTVSVLQYTNEMQKWGKSVCYILLTKDITFSELQSYIIDNCNHYDIICIDEITRCVDFIDGAAWLSDVYAKQGNIEHIIITGTDSYALDVAKDTTLLDRMYYINTSVITYSEYFRLFGKSFNEYLKACTMFSVEDLQFKSINRLLEMTVFRNISNSLKRNGESLKLTESELLYYIFNLVLKQVIESFDLDKLLGDTPCCDKKIRSELRDLANNRVLHRLLDDTENIIFEKTKMINTCSLIEDLGVLLKIDNRFSNSSHYIVTLQGVNYILIDMYNEELRALCIQRGIKLQANTAVYGHVYECVIISNLIKYGYDVVYLRSEDGNFEVDLMVKTKTSVCFLEVKSKTVQDNKDFRHLRNTQILEQFCDNGLKCKDFVLYMGKSDNLDNDCYVNIEDFLLNIKKYVE